MPYANPDITGLYHPLYNPNNYGVFHCSYGFISFQDLPSIVGIMLSATIISNLNIYKPRKYQFSWLKQNNILWGFGVKHTPIVLWVWATRLTCLA